MGLQPNGMAGQHADAGVAAASAAQMQSLLSRGAGFAPGALSGFSQQQLLERLEQQQQQLQQHAAGGRALGVAQGPGAGLSHVASMFAAMQSRMGAGEAQQPQVMAAAHLMAQMHAASAASGVGSIWGHSLGNGLHVDDEMEEDEADGEAMPVSANGYAEAGSMESDDECQEQNGEGSQHRYFAGEPEQPNWMPMPGRYSEEGVSPVRKLDKADVKKAKRGVYAALREVPPSPLKAPFSPPSVASCSICIRQKRLSWSEPFLSMVIRLETCLKLDHL